MTTLPVEKTRRLNRWMSFGRTSRQAMSTKMMMSVDSRNAIREKAMDLTKNTPTMKIMDPMLPEMRALPTE